MSKSSMTKSELIEVIAERTKITKSRAELVVNCIFETMAEALQRGDGIEIRGFGSFTIRHYKPYTGRNPRTNRPVPVGPKKLPFFKVGKDLKDLVNSRAHIPLPTEEDEPDETDLDTETPELGDDDNE
jgi:integration host factor subunit beta